MSAENTEAGVVSGIDVNAGVVSGGDGGLVAGQAESSGQSVATDTQKPGVGGDDDREFAGLPFSKHPRWQEVYGGYKEAKTLKGHVAELEKQIAAWKTGEHPEMRQIAEEIVSARDQFWERELSEAGLVDLIRAHFQRKYGGGGAAATGAKQPGEARQAEVNPEIETLRQEFLSWQREQMEDRIRNEIDLAIREHAAEFTGAPRAVEFLVRRAAELAMAEVKPGARKLPKPMSEYVKTAKQEIVAALTPVITQVAKPAASATKTSAPVGSPGGNPTEEERGNILAIVQALGQLQ